EQAEQAEQAEVYGDAAYGTGPMLACLSEARAEAMVKVQPRGGLGGRFSKDCFTVDLEAEHVRCPNQQTARIRWHRDGSGVAAFGAVCAACPLRERCTTAKNGRDINLSPYEEHLARGRANSADPDWLARYRATRPKVERKIAHMMRRRHGGRRARVRGTSKIDADFSLLAAAVNLARLAVFGIVSAPCGSWTTATA
ncbi:transposase, partial [Nonomuraea turkmeniaca]